MLWIFLNPETKDFTEEARIWNKYEFALLYRFSGKRGGYDWGSAPNPARELSSLDPSLRYRCAIAERGNSYLAAQKEILQCACALLAKRLKTAAKRRKGAGNEVPCRGLGQRPNRNPRVVHTFVDNFVGCFGNFQEFSTAQNPVDNSVFGTYPSCQPTYDSFC